VVELNRAVAVGMAYGPRAGLAIVDEIEPALPGFHLVPAVRGDLLSRLGRHLQAATQFDHAAKLAANDSERALMRARAEACREDGEKGAGHP
jgi:predicted RNA polymerase sigma factor